MVERRFKLAQTHPTHAGYITPIRSVVHAATRRKAEAEANRACEDALVAISPIEPAEAGEWVGNAIVLYPMEVG
jgi:hypothetical protein